MIDLSQLDDETAQRILTTIARARSGRLPGAPPLSDLRPMLAKDFQVAASPASVSAGDLARQALVVLAEDPATRAAIEAMAAETAPASRHSFNVAESMALGMAAYFALSTAIEIERDKGGKWS